MILLIVAVHGATAQSPPGGSRFPGLHHVARRGSGSFRPGLTGEQNHGNHRQSALATLSAAKSKYSAQLSRRARYRNERLSKRLSKVERYKAEPVPGRDEWDSRVADKPPGWPTPGSVDMERPGPNGAMRANPWKRHSTNWHPTSAAARPVGAAPPQMLRTVDRAPSWQASYI